jgi:sugar lactone lactonase YvrE
MFAKPSRFSAKDFIAKRKLVCFPALTLAICASTGWAQAPPVVVDAQQTIGTLSLGAQGIAVSKNGTVFIADTGNNQILALNPKTGATTPVSTGGITLAFPAPVALDTNGDLFVGDTPSGIGGRIVELTGDGTGNLTGAASTYFAGAPLTNPFALTVDSAGTLFIGDFPASGDGVIYSLAAGGNTLTALSLPGLPTQFTPSSLFRAGTNLYIADNGAGDTGIGGVYLAPATGGTAQRIPTYSFSITNPTGIRLDAAGNIYILTYLTTGSGYNSGQQVVVVPAASPTTPYILPTNGILYGTDMQFDLSGNLDVLDYASGTVDQLTWANPVNVGNKINVGGTGSPVQFNFEFNQATTLRGFQVSTQGDVSQELTQGSGGTCVNGRHTNLGAGGPTISNFFPYTCLENYSGTPTYPGLRSSAVQVKGVSGTILGSLPVYQTGLAGAEITYPVNSRSTASGLINPQDVVISGLDKTVYVSDSGAGVVYSVSGLGGSALTPVPTGAITLSAPSGLALDGAGNLFITDFNTGQLVEVPTTTGLPPSVVNTGGLLQHPISVALDYVGNIYIGDAGPLGNGANYTTPGYVVKIPVGGSPFQMTIPSVPIAYPQSLATDPTSAALAIGDGGDEFGTGAKVLEVSADGTTANVVPIDGVTNPSGLAFDPADQLYVLDLFANTITVVPPTGDQHLLIFNNSTLLASGGFGISAGGQSFVLASLANGAGNYNLLLLNGNRSTLAFGGVKLGNQSDPQTATEYNIGNLPLTLSSPYYTTDSVNAAFSVLGSTTCSNALVLDPYASCAINVQFTPGTLGQTTQQLTVQSDGYNGGSGAFAAPILTVRGTGDPAGNRKRK